MSKASVTIARESAYADGEYDRLAGNEFQPLELDRLSDSDADWVQGEYANGYAGRPYGY